MSVLNGVFTCSTCHALTVGFLGSALALFRLDPSTSPSGAVTSEVNVGHGVGDVNRPAGSTLFPDAAKLLLCFGMEVGRL